MLINEVCKECSLTKKAVEYYIEQGLIFPTIQENGYRCFSDEDAECLKKISVLRDLGLSVADIRLVLPEQDTKLLNEIAAGNYGRFICAHFAPYLNEPVTTDEQQDAFNTIIDFLDNTDCDVPDDMQEYMDEVLGEAAARCENGIDGLSEKMTASVNDAVQNPEKFLDDNREIIEQIQAYRQSDEYKASPAYRLQESFRQFGRTSGYNDIFIPAMCRLSRSYREYQEALKRADEKLLQEYPEYV